jgi:hypothetical protein
MGRALARGLALASAALLLVPAAYAAPGLEFGFSDDAPKWYADAAVAPASYLGAQAFRLTLAWKPGQTDLDAERQAALAQGVDAVTARGLRVVLTVFADSGADAPTDELARRQYCAFVRAAIARNPAIDDVVIWNEPNSDRFWRPQFDAEGTSVAPAAYAALLARCYDVLHAFRPTINVVGLATAPRGDDASSHSPGRFIRELGAAYRGSVRALPIFDTVSHHVYGDSFTERPWRRHVGSKTIALADWDKLMANLAEAFAGTGQPLPGECTAARCVSIWYLEGGFQTSAAPGAGEAHTGRETSRETIAEWAGGEPDVPAPGPETDAPDQATQLVDALRLAYCQPYVTAFHNFLLLAETRLEGWQSGVLRADWTPKASLFALAGVVAEVNADAVDCARVALRTGAR